jgi:hypothetical protein
MRVNPSFYLLLLSLLLLGQGCFSLQKELDRGNNDAVLHHAVRKVSGKNKKKPKYVRAIEVSLERANRADLQSIGQLENSNISDKYLQILRAYERIRGRQESIQPLLPLVDAKGYQAQFQFVKTLGAENEYRIKAVEYLYASAQGLMVQARRADRASARQAFRQLEEISQMVGEYKDIRALSNEARELGTVYIVVVPSLGRNLVMSKNAADLFLNFHYPEISGPWKTVHYRPEQGRKYDLKVDFVLDEFSVSPEREASREYTEKKTIKPEPKKDQEGNPIPDRSNREIEVEARVVELHQSKQALVNGRILVTDLSNSRQIYTQTYSAVEDFSNYASTFQGDKRALSKETLKRVGGRPLPFPSNEAMLYNGTETLKRQLVSMLRRWYDDYGVN